MEKIRVQEKQCSVCGHEIEHLEEDNCPECNHKVGYIVSKDVFYSHFMTSDYNLSLSLERLNIE